MSQITKAQKIMAHRKIVKGPSISLFLCNLSKAMLLIYLLVLITCYVTAATIECESITGVRQSPTLTL